MRQEERRRASQATYPLAPDEWRSFDVELTDSELTIGGWQVMQRWEEPLMQVLAREVTESHGDILEVGYGMGIAAREILARGCSSYTVIEAHPEIAANARAWGHHQDVPVEVLEGFWQDVLPSLSQRFDGLLFDTYPLHAAERGRNHFPFIPESLRVLKETGVFTYYSDETTAFRSDHMDVLLSCYDQVTLIAVRDLHPPPDCEYWQSDTMAVPVAQLPRQPA
jgi:guanidinoacetate N-methyltransferase